MPFLTRAPLPSALLAPGAVLGGQGLDVEALEMGCVVPSLEGGRRSCDFLHVSRDQLMRLQSLIPGWGVQSVYSASIAFEDKGTLVFYCPIPSIEASSRVRRGEGKDSFPYDRD